MSAPPLNLDWITPNLAVGGSFGCEQAQALATEHRVAAVVDLRSEACDDQAALARGGIDFLHLPTDDHCAVSARDLDHGVRFVNGHLASERRVLIHCEHGIGRSAVLALCVLVDGGLSPLAALELAKRRRGVISPSPAQHSGWSAWLQARGLEPPAFDAFAAIAYRHLRAG